MADAIRITLYRWAGQKWLFRIRSECAECDLAVGQVRRLLSAHPDWPLDLEVKPWLTHLWESLRFGGWHAPVVLVDGKLVRQGTIPTRAELEAALRRALERRGISLTDHRKQEEPPQAATDLTPGG
jgi:hypothetical protein